MSLHFDSKECNNYKYSIYFCWQHGQDNIPLPVTNKYVKLQVNFYIFFLTLRFYNINVTTQIISGYGDNSGSSIVNTQFSNVVCTGGITNIFILYGTNVLISNNAFSDIDCTDVFYFFASGVVDRVGIAVLIYPLVLVLSNRRYGSERRCNNIQVCF